MNDFSDQMEITEGEFYLPHEEGWLGRAYPVLTVVMLN